MATSCAEERWASRLPQDCAGIAEIHETLIRLSVLRAQIGPDAPGHEALREAFAAYSAAAARCAQLDFEARRAAD